MHLFRKVEKKKRVVPRKEKPCKPGAPIIYGSIRTSIRKPKPNWMSVINSHVILITFNNIIFIKPFNINRGIAGSFTFKYTHPSNIVSVCHMKMKFSFVASCFDSPGVYSLDDKYESYWLLYDSEENFTLISTSLKSTIRTFQVPNLPNFTQQKHLEMLGCGCGKEFAIPVNKRLFIIRIHKHKPAEIVLNIFHKDGIKVRGFLSGFLVHQARKLFYWNKSELTTYYQTYPSNDFFVTTGDRFGIIQRRGKKNLVFHIVHEGGIGISNVRLFSVCGDWAIAVCHGRTLTIANINDKFKGVQCHLPNSMKAPINTFEYIHADFRQIEESLVVLIAAGRKIFFVKVALSLLEDVSYMAGGPEAVWGSVWASDDDDNDEDDEEEEEEADEISEEEKT